MKCKNMKHLQNCTGFIFTTFLESVHFFLFNFVQSILPRSYKLSPKSGVSAVLTHTCRQIMQFLIVRGSEKLYNVQNEIRAVIKYLITSTNPSH